MSKKLTLVLEFATELERKYFTGQLLDGWGENHANYKWADGKTPYKAGMPITVDCLDDALEAKERHDRCMVALGLPPSGEDGE